MNNTNQPRSALQRCMSLHNERIGHPNVVTRAPGRVNLIGEHTDYNNGFVLPIAIEFDTVVCISGWDSDDTTDSSYDDNTTTSQNKRMTCDVVSESFGHKTIDVAPNGALNIGTNHWAIHIAGVFSVLFCGESPVIDRGFNSYALSVATDIPTGASLSSSAALEVATIMALLNIHNIQRSTIQIATLGQRVENEIVGLPSGIMDQFISADARVDNVSLIDCQSLAVQHAPIPDAVVIAILDTNTRRQLVSSQFKERRDDCAKAAIACGADSLRDMTIDEIDCLPTEILRKRARHVIGENARTLAAFAALNANTMETVGHLMNESHTSLAHDFDVSSIELNAIVAAAQSHPSCYGARMTGGGFAGCAVALVDNNGFDDFVRSVCQQYNSATAGEIDATIYRTRPHCGAEVLDPDTRANTIETSRYE